MPLRGLLLATLALRFAEPLLAQQAAPVPIVGIDVYGSDALDTDAIRAEFEPELRRYVATIAKLGSAEDPEPLIATLREIDARLRTALDARVPLAMFRISPTTAFQPTPRVYVTIDVVTKADAARRMPFRAAPREKLADPEGLLALWGTYQNKVFELLNAGVSLQVGERECPALHCIATFERPELAPYLARFDAGARRNEDALYAIAERSGEDAERANAIFLLAHTNDAARLMPVLGRAIFDPAEGVRNNAMRVLMFVAHRHPRLDYPIHDLIAAMDFPVASDRNKAAYVVATLVEQPRYRETIRAEAVPTALKLLRLTQPNNHDPAYEILTKLSGARFAERDYAAWERWATTTQ